MSFEQLLRKNSFKLRLFIAIKFVAYIANKSDGVVHLCYGFYFIAMESVLQHFFERKETEKATTKFVEAKQMEY